jgi:hypothetical protein
MNDWQAIKGLIMDMDGVLWRGAEPLGDLASAVRENQPPGLEDRISDQQRYPLVEVYLEKLRSFGVHLEALSDHLFRRGAGRLLGLKASFPSTRPFT